MTICRGRKPPLPNKQAVNSSKLPTVPGMYFWDAYDQLVIVYKKKGGKALYVTPPGVNAIEVKITPRIAGKFIGPQA